MNNDIITVTSPLLPNLEEYNALLQDIWWNKLKPVCVDIADSSVAIERNFSFKERNNA